MRVRLHPRERIELTDMPLDEATERQSVDDESVQKPPREPLQESLLETYENTCQDEAVLYKDMSNSLLTTIASAALWLLISGLNFYMLCSFSTGQDVHL